MTAVMSAEVVNSEPGSTPKIGRVRNASTMVGSAMPEMLRPSPNITPANRADTGPIMFRAPG